MAMQTGCLAVALCMPSILFAQATSRPGDNFPVFETPYFVIHTDLEKDRLREAQVRLITLGEEYARRVQPFTGHKKIAGKLPMCLFSKKADYLAAGGLPRAIAIHNGQKVLAWEPDRGEYMSGWKQTQRECWREFVHAFVSDRVPVWLDEGLGVYYGEALWTGDGYVMGAPGKRDLDVQELIRKKQLTPLVDLVALPRSKWDNLSPEESHRIENQSWSMVQFLIHASDGKHQARLNGYIEDIVAGKSAEDAFKSRFGSDGGPLGKEYQEWWTANPDFRSPYNQATMATFTSFLARAHLSGQKFKNYKEFLDDIGQGKLLNTTSQWLPIGVARDFYCGRNKVVGWSLETAGRKWPRLVWACDDGLVYTGSFQARDGRVMKVEVTATKPKARSNPPVAKIASNKSASSQPATSPADQLQHIKDRIKGYHATPGD